MSRHLEFDFCEGRTSTIRRFVKPQLVEQVDTWFSRSSVEQEETKKVKEITIYPHSSLSFSAHYEGT